MVPAWALFEPHHRLGDPDIAAVIGCPTATLRSIVQEAVRAADDLPESERGGPWAVDEPVNRGSYLFNFGGGNRNNRGRLD